MPTSHQRRGLRQVVTVWAVQGVNGLSRRLGRGSGTVAGGRVGLWLAPDLLSRLLAGRQVVLISGTNGKTTTTALVRAALGSNAATNATGANMPAGVVAALASDGSHVAVLEVDEPFLPTVLAACNSAESTTVVLLNLSRDQLDRSGEVRQLALRWRDGFEQPGTSPLTVIANVSDPLVAFAVESAKHVVAVAVPTSWNSDAASCPVCTRALHFSDHFNCACHQLEVPLTSWSCVCGFVRREPRVIMAEQLHLGGQLIDLDLSLPGPFNRSNAAMALAVAREANVEIVGAVSRVNQISDVAGRFEVRQRWGRTWRLMLAKNPAGFVALLDALEGHEGDLVIAINDNVADGRDPSWLYDVPFERLVKRRVWCQGTRKLDLATRLEYGAVTWQLAENETLAEGGLDNDGPVDVIANYTAFAEWRAASQPC